MNGFLLVNKPSGPTSFDIVYKIRKLFGVKKCGHCGTLDPLADGLLILCIGKATKLASYVVNDSKSYNTKIKLGFTSTTYDQQGEITSSGSTEGLTIEKIEKALNNFRGTILQKPPIYSALKLNGKPLYKYAREKIDVALEAKEREVHINSIEIVNYQAPYLELAINCSKGTYIRSIAHDLGKSLGCGGYVEVLTRTSSGDHSIEQAVTLEELDNAAKIDKLSDYIIPIRKFLKLPQVTLSDETAERVINGVEIRSENIAEIECQLTAKKTVALCHRAGNMLAIGRLLCDSKQIPLVTGQRVIEYVSVL